MSDILVIKMNDGSTVTHFRRLQDYDNLATIAANIAGSLRPNEEIAEYALCNETTLSDAINTGVSIDSGILISQKQDVPGTDTIVPQDGVGVSDLSATDKCVHYTPAA